MKISDIRTGRATTVELRPADVDRFELSLPLESEVLLYHSDVTDETVIKIGDSVWAVTGADARNEEILNELCDRNLPRLCWLAGQHSAGTRLVVQVHSFSVRYDLPEPLKIGVTDEIVERASAHLLHKQASIDDVLRWLTEDAVIETVQSPAILVSAGEQVRRGLGANFRIHGKRINIVVAQAAHNGGYKVTRVINARQTDPQPVMLLRGQFSFCDATAAGEFRGQPHTLLDSIVRQSDSYLALWQQYNRLERENIVRHARESGWLQYSRCEPSPDGEQWRFYLEASTQKALGYLRDDRVDLEVAENLPYELADDAPEADFTEGDDIRQRPRSLVGQCVWADAQTLVLRPSEPERDDPPPERGFIFVALTGDRIRLQRRNTARDRIAYAANPMPHLGLLLEGQSVLVVPHRRIGPQKRDIRAVFDGEPTSRQLAAIELALNTPDIALIQGPPGTGKTRVIAAIERVLASDYRSNGIAGRILLTSYQHDAVEHASGYTVLDLPPIKVGHRSGRRSETDEFADNVERWRKNRVEQLEADLSNCPDTPAGAARRRVRDLATGYRGSPGPPQATTGLLKEIFELAGVYLTSDLRERLIESMHRLRGKTPAQVGDHEEREVVTRAVRALRTDAGTFSDDGSLTAYKLLRRLEGIDWLTEADRAILERAANWDDAEALNLLPDLQSVQERLLDQLMAPTVLDHAGLVNADVDRLLVEVVNALYEQVRRSKDGVTAALEEYLHDLEYDPRGVRRTLRDYTAVLAATCQQSVSLPMEKLASFHTAGWRVEIGLHF